jgi:uncharacterized Zn-binding protein involved in type VI secretion
MSYAHRNTDVRACGATTIVNGQNFVKIDGQLWAVDGDPNTDGGGELITSHTWITINGKGIIVVGDNANPDGLCPIPGGPHCDPVAVGSDNFVNVN